MFDDKDLSFAIVVDELSGDLAKSDEFPWVRVERDRAVRTLYAPQNLKALAALSAV